MQTIKLKGAGFLDKSELVEKIRAIMFSVPDEIYKFSKPAQCFDIEWRESSPKEKAFLLIQELMFNLNREELEEQSSDSVDVKEMCLGNSPTFYNQVDENMFFKAIYTMPSYIQIKGIGKDLYLYYSSPMTTEEKKFLEGLLKRYSMNVPSELIF